MAARHLSPEPGGRLVAEIRSASSRSVYKDSLDWSGVGAATLRLSTIAEGGGYQAVLRYRDPDGRTTHADTLRDLIVRRGTNTQAEFTLKPLLGRLQLTVPTAPVAIDTLGLTWESLGRVVRTKAVRGPSGRTLLRLDSLAVGSQGKLQVRAWNAAGDTLYYADTSTSILSEADQSVSIKLLDARGQIALLASFLAGGETNAVVSFPDDPVATGTLVLAALSDSGSSDWILLQNLSGDSVSGPARISRGTESFSVPLRLGPGERTVLTRAPCAAVAATSHVLHTTPGLVCGLESVSVSWSSTGTLWEVRTPDDQLADQIVVIDGRHGWPDLNSTTARTVRRRANATPLDAAAGRSWCADAQDSPLVHCP